MKLIFTSVSEAQPGPKWQALFKKAWPHYRKWFLSEGHHARAGYRTSLKRLREYMPELVPTYEELVHLAGGGDLAARFLTMYRPPPYLSGCSQAVWTGNHSDGRPDRHSADRPVLVRNYDYSPRLFEGNILFSDWRRPVIAMIDSLWGVLDGINDAGLSLSLAFGGSKSVGDGFGVPIILRYVLEMCDDTEAAVRVLEQIPIHMTYNVTVVDRKGAFATVYLSPNRPPAITDLPVSTNHQGYIEWDDYARATTTVERKKFLQEKLADTDETEKRFVERFLHPPLHSTRFEKAFGTLYTAAYYPENLEVEYHWPHRSLRHSFERFDEGETVVKLKDVAAIGMPHHVR